MYYNSNKVSNDYYNSYKKEVSKLKDERRKENRKKAIKFILSFLILILLLLTSFYFYKYYDHTVGSTSSIVKDKALFSKSKPLPSIVIKEEELPVSIQLLESNRQTIQSIKHNDTDTTQEQRVTASMNKQDIKLIVKIIMDQMNEKIEKSLEEQLQEANDKIIINKSLEELNHYNKVVLSQNEILQIKNNSLMELNNNLQNIVNEDHNKNSNYTEEITKEVIYRKNEMRIIIVQKGDTLSKIAKKAYGDYSHYKKIFTANPEIIQNPNQIFVGQRLRIPS